MGTLLKIGGSVANGGTPSVQSADSPMFRTAADNDGSAKKGGTLRRISVGRTVKDTEESAGGLVGLPDVTPQTPAKAEAPKTAERVNYFDIDPAGQEINNTPFDVDPAKFESSTPELATDTPLQKAVASIAMTVGAAPSVVGEILKTEMQAHKEYHKDNPTPVNYFDIDPAGQESDDTPFDIDPEQFKNTEVMPGLSEYQKPVDMNSAGMKQMGEAVRLRQEATENLSGFAKTAADAAIGVGQTVSLLPLAAVNPSAPLIAMAAVAGAQEMYDQTAQGMVAGDALSRGLMSGIIEAATEKVPVDMVLDLVKVGGKSVIKNILKQAGTEATEEGVSYVLNYLVDKARDPEATFSMEELWENVKAGGLSGLFFGLGGTVVGNVKNGQSSTPSGTDQQPTAGVNLPATGTNDAGAGVGAAEQKNAPNAIDGAEAEDYYFDPNEKNISWRKRMYSENEKTYIQSQDLQRMYEVPSQSEIEYFIQDDGTITLKNDVFNNVFDSDYRDFVKAYSDMNLITHVDPKTGEEIDPKPIIIKDDGARVVITQTGINDVAKKIRSAGLKSRDNVSSILLLNRIIENSRRIGPVDNKHGKKTQFTEYKAKFSVGDRPYDVVINIKNAAQGDRYHYHTLENIKVEPTDGSNGADSTGTYQANSTFYNTKLSQKKQGVKDQSAQEGAGLSAGKRDLLSDWELDRPVASKRDLLADWELQGTPAAQATEAETVGEEYWHSIMDEGAVPASETDTPGYFDALLEWVDRQRVPAEPKKAAVATRPATAKKSLSQKADEAWSFFKRKMVDAGDTVTKIGKTVGDWYLYAYYNFARASSNAAEQMITDGGAQTNVYGEKVGQSLADLWEPIRAEGDEYYRRFEEYLLHRHNIDRMSRYNAAAVAQAESSRQAFIELYPWIALETEQRLRSMAELGPFQMEAQSYLALVKEVNRLENTRNKPVFGWEVDADASRAEVAKIEREHPEFKGLAEQVYKYNRNLMQYRVDSGLMTREQADKLEEIYPHYVPTYRQTENDVKTRRKKGVQVGKTVGRAEGGNANLMPLHLAMARQTMQVTREGAKNRFGARLLEDVLNNEAALKDYVRSAEEYEWEPHPDTFDALDDPTPQKTNTFTVFRDGRAWVMEVDEGLFEAVSALSPEGKEANVLTKAVRSANDLFKKLVTGYNPMFMARNVVRDLQDAGLYSKDLSAWTQNYPLAVKEIVTDGEYWKKYKALGGTYSSVFDYEQGYQTDESRSFLSRNVLDRIEALNMATEQAPRLAEFMATVKKGDGSMDNLMEAMYNAADVTVNFGRGGTLGKNLNQNFVPFLNPGIQGFDKMVRRFAETKGAKEWSKLIVKCAALGIAPTLINAFLYKDDEEWEDLKDSDKDVNYLIKLGDGKWLKIPKGRTLSLMGMAADRAGDALRGEEVDFAGMITTAANQIAPANPLENNIMAAWVDADLFDQSSPGKTWYGSDLEGQRLQNYEPGQRYDESTDVFSKWLGGVLNLSPKKINYLLDQYSGVVGDFVLPLLTPQAEQNPFAKSFVLDSVTSNKINGEFYDKSDEITFAKNGGDGAMALVSRFWNKQSGAVSDIYAQIREIENDTRLTDAEKKEQVREAKAILNGVQKNALEVLPEYEAAVRKYYTGSSSEELDLAYRKANCEVFGAEYALKVYDKSVYEKAASLEKKGIDYSAFYDAYFAQRDVTGDPDGKGGTVYLSASRNKKKAIDEATPWLNPWSRQILYEAFGVSEKVW